MTNVDKQTNRPFAAVQPVLPDVAPRNAEAAAAWTEFCDGLKRAGHRILSQPGVEDDLMQAETLRYFIRELRTGLELNTEHGLSDQPRFQCGDAAGSGPPGPNLDNSYYSSRVKPGVTYRVRIDTRTIGEIIFGISNRDYRNYGDYCLADFEIGDDGILEIVASPERKPGNWVKMPDDAYRLSVRVYYIDWEKHSPPAMSVERIDPPGVPGSVPTIAALAGALTETVELLESWPYKYPIFQTLYADQIEANQMRAPLGIPGGGEQIQYGLARFRLADDESLIVESEVPRARYWGFHTYTMPWFSPIEPATRVTALNHLQSRIDNDGMVRYVVSGSDPGVQNWLDTGGFPTGAVFYRWIWSENSPAPVARLVKLDEVRSSLPANTPQFTAADRRAQIAVRRRHLQRRLRA